MKEIQQRIDRMILHLGGYWRPLSGLARLLEEVGEVGAALRRGQEEQLKEELLDVIVISTCLANQYAIPLQHPDQLNETDSVPSLYFRLVEEAGEVARILNAYEGDKALKPNKINDSLQSHLEGVQSAVMAIGGRFGFDLFAALYPLIEEKSSRDFGRFDQTPDPITEPSVRNYLHYKTGRYWGGVEVKPFEKIDRYIKRERHFERFLKLAPIERLDGFVIQQPKDGLLFGGDLYEAFPVPDSFIVEKETYDDQVFFVIRLRP